ncbi:MAG TPA: response regulator transcription factor [Gaiellaceae bacterium]|nr:response regulator transcription factor [Gaiellaceae bacterium]
MTENPLRILICEDDEKLASLVSELLDADGRFIVVATARSGGEAVRLAEEHAPDVVLMDIGMPGLDGIGATRAIHERDSGQHVVIYTGSDQYGDVARAEEAGATGFLHKEALTSPDLADAIHVLHANYVASVPDPD